MRSRVAFSTADNGKAIELLLKLLMSRNELTQIKASQALALLAVDDCAKTAIRLHGGIPALVKLLRPKFCRNETVLESATQIVLLLCYEGAVTFRRANIQCLYLQCAAYTSVQRVVGSFCGLQSQVCCT
eukprot:SAG31_NODE_386_length_16407_cov_24.639686_3_plen_129_part_00